MKNFDPEDYIQKNSNVVMNCASPIKNFSCLECNRSDFDTFKKFSIHRRNVHSTFHCDLCNKVRNTRFYCHIKLIIKFLVLWKKLPPLETRESAPQKPPKHNVPNMLQNQCFQVSFSAALC